MKKFKLLTLTLLVLAICMTSVSATAALNPAGTYADGVVTVTANGEAGSADATIIATRQAGTLAAAPAFSDAEVLASIVYIDQVPAAADLSFSFAPARVAEGDTVSVFMAGAGASGVEVANVALEEEEEIIRTLTLNLNGGALAEEAPANYPAEGYTLPVPTKNAYAFLGWYADAEFSGEAVVAISAEDALAGGAKEYFAKWTANVVDFASDAGYTAEAADAEEKEGVISVTVEFGTHITEGVSYGFLVYLAEDDSVKLDIAAEGFANNFYTVTYGIPATAFDTDVVFLPFVEVSEGNFVYGEAEALTVNEAADGELKYLGTIDNLTAQLN